MKLFKDLTKFEMGLWFISNLTIISSYVLFRGNNTLTLLASLIGATALIFVAKGNVIGQVLTVVFSIFYSVISYEQQYYGEMITYLGMTTPIALMSIASWLKHPYKGEKRQVKIARLSKNNRITMVILTIVVTLIFYFILKYFNTTNLFLSTVSIATSFLASYLMLFRSHAYALAYAANDIVLILLWVLISFKDLGYISMVICFIVFLINDLYGFYNWKRMKAKQNS